MSRLLLKKITYSKNIFFKQLLFDFLIKNYIKLTLFFILTPFGFGVKKFYNIFDIYFFVNKSINFLILKNLLNVKITISLFAKNLIGLYWNLIKNFIQDYTKIYFLEIEFRGTGYKGILLRDDKIQIFKLFIGYTHTVFYNVPKFIIIKESKILLSKLKKYIILGFSRQKVVEIIMYLKALRVIDRYKGKGLFFIQERLSLKAVKQQKK